MATRVSTKLRPLRVQEVQNHGVDLAGLIVSAGQAPCAGLLNVEASVGIARFGQRGNLGTDDQVPGDNPLRCLVP